MGLDELVDVGFYAEADFGGQEVAVQAGAVAG